MTQTTTVGLLSLLEEDEECIKIAALLRLIPLLDDHYHECAENLSKLENLYQDETFPKRRELAYVISKVYFHLCEYDDCIKYALDAHDLIDIQVKDNEYIDKVVAYCIDKYIVHQTQDSSGKEVDARLLQIVESMLERCLKDRESTQVIGLAIDCRRLDYIKKGIETAENVDEMLKFTLKVISESPDIKVDFKSKVLQSIIEVYQTREKPDFFNVVECYLFLNLPVEVGSLIVDLMKDNTEVSELIAYQICFDLHDRATQQFRGEVKRILNEKVGSESERLTGLRNTLLKILIGEVTIALHVDFLYRRNKTDIGILNNIKNSFETSSVLHNATIIANSFMHCGTTIDYWLRSNLSWLSKACNRGKFSATASIGVIHLGQYKDSLKVITPYLPKDLGGPGGGSVYSESGSLYALGLIHSTHDGPEMIETLTKFLENKKGNLVIAHGACLGVGLCALGTGEKKIAEVLEQVISLDKAVSGETAGIATGLVMMGSGDKNFLDILLQYSHNSAHEKIVRGCSVGMALMNYGKAQGADGMINLMLADEEPWIRFGGCYMIGMAYCGIPDDVQLRILLRIAVSDPSDDVRRAAVINLGFLLFNNPRHASRVMELLAESFNPHVRYAVAISLGVACAGTGELGALRLMETLAKDVEGFVRQGAYIGTAMILMQYNENSIDGRLKSTNLGKYVKAFRDKFKKSWSEREEILAKMGAVLAQGIVDAGGRNVTITIHKNGHVKPKNVAGMMMFTQFWYWYPYLHFLGLAMEPTAIIGLNKQLEMPKFRFKSNAKPSLFAYPKNVKEEEVKRKKLGPLAILSQAKRRRRGGVGSKGPFSPFTPNPTHPKEQEFKAQEAREKKKKEEELKKEKERDALGFEILENPSRVTMHQSRFLTFKEDPLYEPVKEKQTLGILMLKQMTDDKGEVIERKNTMESLVEPDPPKPFEWP